jgi:hypothetical protein
LIEETPGEYEEVKADDPTMRRGALRKNHPSIKVEKFKVIFDGHICELYCEVTRENGHI